MESGGRAPRTGEVSFLVAPPPEHVASAPLSKAVAHGQTILLTFEAAGRRKKGRTACSFH